MSSSCLVPPLLEMFPTDRPFFDILAVRSGPDRLDLHTFDPAPVQVTGVAYWYRDHLWCEEPECRCVLAPRDGDGFCIVRYEDGRYGWLELRTVSETGESIDWNGAEAFIDADRLAEIRRLGINAAQVDLTEAFVGVWKAFDEAVARGVFADRANRKVCDTASSRRSAWMHEWSRTRYPQRAEGTPAESHSMVSSVAAGPCSERPAS
jgi:hypothetical protein